MRTLLPFIIVLLVSGLRLNAQRIELAPYPDAVSYSETGIGNMFLSNTDARTLMEYFVSEYMPDKIIPVREGYYSGFRLCFTKGMADPHAEAEEWIQILTVDPDEAMAYLSKIAPEALTLPFNGLKSCIGKKHTKEDFSAVYEQYRHIVCRIYRQVTGPDGKVTDEMTALIENCRMHNLSSGQALYATSGRGGGVFSQEKNDDCGADPWTEWIGCFGKIENLGYTTLIEINEPSIVPFMN